MGRRGTRIRKSQTDNIFLRDQMAENPEKDGRMLTQQIDQGLESSNGKLEHKIEGYGVR